MRVLMIEPGKVPTIMKIGNNLESMQKAVDGLIEVTSFDENIVLVDNEEGKAYYVIVDITQNSIKADIYSV